MLTESPNISSVYKKILRIDPLSIEASQISFVYSNLVSEFQELCRKYGCPKFLKDGTYTEFDVINPEYVSFIVEAVILLNISKNKHLDTIYATHLLLEDWVIRGGEGDLVLNLDNLIESVKVSDLQIHPDVRIWMKENYGYLACKKLII